MYNLNIYAADATIRTDIPDTEIAKLSKNQQTAYFDVMSSLSDTTEADAAVIAKEKARRAAISNLKRLMDGHEKIAPARTFYDEWKRTVAKIPEPEPDPDTVKKVAASLKTIEKANEHYEQCTLDEVAAKQVRAEKRQAFATAIIAWSRLDGLPKTVGDLIKARSETERKIAMDNIANGLPPDYAVAQASTVGGSHLDRFKAGQGKGGSVNVGYNPNRMRGAQLRMKPPSER
jgi:hypothetical protein